MLFGLFGKKDKEETVAFNMEATEELVKTSVDEVIAEPIKEEIVVEAVAETPVEIAAEAVEQESSQEDDIKDVIAPLPASAGADPGSLQARFPYLNIEEGLSYCGMMEDFYLEMMGEFMEVDEPEQMQKYFELKDWANYRIHAHALKSTARTIGATRMFERALGLEEAAKEENADYIIANHQKVLDANVILGEQLKKDLGN